MYGVELYAAVRLAVVDEGLSHHEAGRRFGIDRRTVKKMLSYSAPPGYRRRKPVRRPKLDGFTGIVDAILEADRDPDVPRKQRHTTPASVRITPACPRGPTGPTHARAAASRAEARRPARGARPWTTRTSCRRCPWYIFAPPRRYIISPPLTHVCLPAETDLLLRRCCAGEGTDEERQTGFNTLGICAIERPRYMDNTRLMPFSAHLGERISMGVCWFTRPVSWR